MINCWFYFGVIINMLYKIHNIIGMLTIDMLLAWYCLLWRKFNYLMFQSDFWGLRIKSSLHFYKYIYIYTDTHTHTHIYIYISMLAYACVNINITYPCLSFLDNWTPFLEARICKVMFSLFSLSFSVSRREIRSLNKAASCWTRSNCFLQVENIQWYNNK